MRLLDIIDHSPHHPEPSPPIPTASNVILIDNYDSFAWNVYQYLILEGGNVTVFRNDQVTVEELIARNPTQLVVSPGPGHPATDSGVSRDAIRHFAGKIPILGVCMGQSVHPGASVHGSRLTRLGNVSSTSTAARSASQGKSSTARRLP